MNQLKVIAEFRDINDFSQRHEVGETIFVADGERAARLVRLGLCEEVSKQKVVEIVDAEKPIATDTTEDSADVPDDSQDDGGVASGQTEEPTENAGGEGSEEQLPADKPVQKKPRKNAKKQ